MKPKFQMNSWEFNTNLALKSFLNDYNLENLKKELIEILPSKGMDFLKKNLEIDREGDFSLKIGLSESGAKRNDLNISPLRSRFDSWRAYSIREALEKIL